MGIAPESVEVRARSFTASWSLPKCLEGSGILPHTAE